jgi:ATP-binding cassette subfamily F protein 3
MIRFTNLSVRRGLKLLLDDVSAVVNPGEKVGLVGANGSGKSTLFALLQGALTPDQGDLSVPGAWRVAHVAQETVTSSRHALDFVIDGDRHLRAIEHRLEHEQDDDQLAHLHMAYGDADGYTAMSRGEALLLGLGFTLEQARQPVVEFSGGWRMRLQLAQALMAPSDLLLLDEPTNHLDLDAIVWLEQWLRRYEGTLVVISHDREFLDAVCGVTLALENQKLTRWTGNYSSYEVQRAERMKLTGSAYDKQQRTIAHLQHFVDRFKAKATKAKQAQSRVKAMERMTLIAPVIESSPFTFKFRTPLSSPDPILVLEHLDCGYPADDGTPSRVVVGDVDLRIASGERIGLLGANGQGKSTLIKTIEGSLERVGGILTPGRGLVVGYFAQHQVDMLDREASPLLQLQRVAIANHPQEGSQKSAPREQELRDYLGSFDFRGEMATSSVAPFSGGEKARLALALIIWTRPNLLLLDEPTNHLDLETREALTLALAQFEGTLILVSHDRALLRAVSDRFLLVADGRCKDFDGDLDDYRAWSLKRLERKPVVVAPAIAKAPPAAPAPNAAPIRGSSSQKKKPIEERIRRIEKSLAAAEAARKLIDDALASPDAYEAEQREALQKRLADQAYLTRDIEKLEAEWLEQQALLEKAA